MCGCSGGEQGNSWHSSFTGSPITQKFGSNSSASTGNPRVSPTHNPFRLMQAEDVGPYDRWEAPIFVVDVVSCLCIYVNLPQKRLSYLDKCQPQ
jgi:hypothetical protein